MPKDLIILLNGPPASGKDSLADALISVDSDFIKGSLAYPIKQANKAFFNLTDEQVKVLETDRDAKETKQSILLGKTWREVNILMAEELIKKNYSKDAFGMLLIGRLKSAFKTKPKNGIRLVVSDCGFKEEIEPLIKEFGKESVHLIQLSRVGTDFKKDSRDYVDCKDLGIKTHKLANKGSMQDFLRDGVRLVQKIKQAHK